MIADDSEVKKVKKYLTCYLGEYSILKTALDEMKKEGNLEPNLYDTLMGELTHKFITNFSTLTDYAVMQDVEIKIPITINHYVKAKKALKKYKLSNKDINNILMIFFNLPLK